MKNLVMEVRRIALAWTQIARDFNAFVARQNDAVDRLVNIRQEELALSRREQEWREEEHDLYMKAERQALKLAAKELREAVEDARDSEETGD